MHIPDFINILNKNNINILLSGENLTIEFPGKELQSDYLFQIKNYKQEIVEFLRAIESLNRSLNEKERTELIPLSFSQEKIWFLDQLHGTISYHLPIVIKIKGKLSFQLLEESIFEIVKRHEVLRTTFVDLNGVPHQYINNETKLDINYQLNSEFLSLENVHLQIRNCVENPFDLKLNGPIRVDLFKIDEETNILLIVLHHIAADGWSMSLLSHELIEIYKSKIENINYTLPKLNIQFADFSIWQHKAYLLGVFNSEIQYWKTTLKDIFPLPIPADYHRVPFQNMKAGHVISIISNSKLESIKNICKEEGVTLFMFLIAVFKILIFKYTEHEEIYIGTQISNRKLPGSEFLIGFFVNTIIIKSHVENKMSFVDLLSQIKETTLKAYENQNVPFEKIIEDIPHSRNNSFNSLVPIMFIFQNTPEVQMASANDLHFSFEEYQMTYSIPKFDITFDLRIIDNSLKINIEYATDLFKYDRIARMIEHYMALVNSVINNKLSKIADLEIVNELEKSTIINDFNLSREPKRILTYLSQIKKQSNINPYKIAVKSGNNYLSYDEYLRQVNNLIFLFNNLEFNKKSTLEIVMDNAVEIFCLSTCFENLNIKYEIKNPLEMERNQNNIYSSINKIIVTNNNLISKISKIYHGPLINLDNLK